MPRRDQQPENHYAAGGRGSRPNNISDWQRGKGMFAASMCIQVTLLIHEFYVIPTTLVVVRQSLVC